MLAGYHLFTLALSSDLLVYCDEVLTDPVPVSFCPANISQPAFTCSKLTIETLEQGVKYVKVTIKNTRRTSITPFWCFYS